MKKVIFLKSILPFVLISHLSFLISFSTVQAAGLVPCGGSGQSACTLCDLFGLFKNLIDFAMMLIFPLATVMIIYGGFLIMTTGDSPTRAQQGRGVIKAAVIGILIALLSWLVLDTIFKVLAPNFEGNFGPWNDISCQ